MNKLTQSLKSIPRGTQYLLMGVAFIVVVILLWLLLAGRSGNVPSLTPEDAAIVTSQSSIELVINPSEVDWSNTPVGERVSQRFEISSIGGAATVMSVSLSDDMNGTLSARNTCENSPVVNDIALCTISLEYTPTTATENTSATINIEWRGATQPDILIQTATIPVVVGAIEKLTEHSEQSTEPAPVILQEIETIAPPLPIFTEPEPLTQTTNTDTSACSEFAFGGYDNSGNQIGWIKPMGGAYYYYPFSDTNCLTPAGVYNPDTGIIADVANPARKIGTDAEHIGYASNPADMAPVLSNPTPAKPVNRARQLSNAELDTVTYAGSKKFSWAPKSDVEYVSSGQDTVTSTKPYDRTFILRQYKPIPATIVSEIRADQRLLTAGHRLPVVATVDRNVYSDNGRTIIVPTGTALYGYITGDLPGPYKAIGRMEIRWYQFVRPDGVEFNWPNEIDNHPFSGDAQGRSGVPGHGSTDYMEQFVMPLLTAIVPAAVNMIAPISDRFVNQIDLDNNTVTQSGQVRSSELAKNEIITAWNQVAQKLLVDMMDNTVPPFSIAAGTRINVFSPVDLQVTCGDPNADDASGKKCEIHEYGKMERAEPGKGSPMNDPKNPLHLTMGTTPENAGSMVGQVRSFNLEQWCARDSNTGYFTGGVIPGSEGAIMQAGYDYRTVLFFCQSAQYQAINNAKQAAVYNNQQQTGYTNQGQIVGPSSTITPADNGITGSYTGNPTALGNQQYNENVLGLEYNADGTIKNPFIETPAAAANDAMPVINCGDGTPPDQNGCCVGEVYTDMGEQGFNCCPTAGGDCFPPIV